jgi:signal transduction histidine kinase/CheY-like chemotaxis protein
MHLIKQVRSFYHYLANLGIDPTGAEDQRNQKLLNILCTIWYHAAVLFLVGSYWFSRDLWYLTLRHVVFLIAVCGLVQYLNVRAYTGAAKLLFLGTTLVQCIFFSVTVKPGEMVELFTLTVPLVAVVLYDRFSTYFSVLVASIGATLISLFLLQDHSPPPIVAVVVALIYVTPFFMMVYLKQINKEKEVLLAIERNNALADKSLIEEQAEELRALNDFKSHFFVNISHEIRTPLTLISGYARRLIAPNQNGAQSDYARGIVEQSAVIQHLVDSIIDLSKLDKKKLTLSKTDVDLARLLRKIYAEFNDAFAQAGRSLRLDLPEETFTIACDAVLMNRAVTNLITNALKFTHPGGEVRLTLTQNAQGALLIKVYNPGIGIPPQDQARIFERFYQAKNEITRSQGSGIGLSMTQGIIESHGYQITVESEPDRYALFTISIPAQEVRTSEARTAQSEVTAEVLRPTLPQEQPKPLLPGRKRILLVEDNAAMRRYIMDIEAMSNYTILEARHGKEALELLQQQEVDLIVTDYMMPYLDGRALVDQIKQRGYTQPVLVITAQTDPQYKLDILRMGIDGYLTKPFLEEEFSLLVQKSLEYDAARRQFIAQEAGKEGVPAPEATLDDFNRQLREVVDQNIDNEQFSVGELGERLHLTERTLFRRVKELCGCTPAKLITEARLMRAKAYYDQKAYRSTRQLARAVGFKNSTRFAEKFRERFGVTP